MWFEFVLYSDLALFPPLFNSVIIQFVLNKHHIVVNSSLEDLVHSLETPCFQWVSLSYGKMLNSLGPHMLIHLLCPRGPFHWVYFTLPLYHISHSSMLFGSVQIWDLALSSTFHVRTYYHVSLSPPLSPPLSCFFLNE